MVATTEPQRIWVALRLGAAAEAKIAILRDRVGEFLPSEFQPEQSPHVSVLPGAIIPAAKYNQLAATVDTASTIPEKVHVTGISVYPLVDPYVVRLDVAVTLRELRTQLIDRIYELSGELLYPPVKPHITLFKTGNQSESSPQLLYSEYKELHRKVDAVWDTAGLGGWWIEDVDIELASF